MICVLVGPQSTTDDVVLSRVPGLPPLFEQHHQRCYHDNISGRLSHDVRTSAAYQAESVLAQVDGPSLVEGVSHHMIYTFLDWPSSTTTVPDADTHKPEEARRDAVLRMRSEKHIIHLILVLVQPHVFSWSPPYMLCCKSI